MIDKIENKLNVKHTLTFNITIKDKLLTYIYRKLRASSIEFLLRHIYCNKVSENVVFGVQKNLKSEIFARHENNNPAFMDQYPLI